MTSQARLSTELVEFVEGVRYDWTVAMADQVITADEAVQMSRSLELLEQKSADIDEGIALGIAVFRRGPESVRAAKLIGERRQRLRQIEPASSGAA